MRARALVLAAAIASIILAPAAAQAGETKIAQAFDVGSSFRAASINPDSPFLLLSDGGGWAIGSTVSGAYSLTFASPGVSGRASLSAFASAPADFAFSLDQCWARATVADGWGIKFGRFDLNWRDGGRWNPSDVINNKATWGRTGPIAGRDALEILGVVPLPGLALDLNLATAFSAEYDSFADIPLYAALGTILYPLELRLKAALPPGTFSGEALPLLGASAKGSLMSLNAYADALFLFEDPLAEELGGPAGEGFRARWCVGANYAWSFEGRFAKSLSLGAEYLRQDDGLSREQGSAYLDGLASWDVSTPEGQALYAQRAGLWGGRFFSLYRDYACANAALTGIARQNLDASVGAVVNLDDGGFALSSSVTWRPRGLFDLSLSATNYGGPEGSEGLSLSRTAEYALGMKKSF